jgi:hypothetical protein
MKNLLLPFLLIITTIAAAQTEMQVEKSRKWFLPDHLKLQFAGNIGFMSGGPGYISRNKTLETDLMFGFLPQKFGGDALISLTGKTTYSLWRIHLKNSYNIVPFSLGMYLSYTFGPQFDTKWPSYYPVGYYWWATAFRPGAYIGGKIGKDITLGKKTKKFEFYYELGSYDLLMISYVQNTSYLNPGDIANLAFGLKMAF